jgi:hypothetical protein
MNGMVREGLLGEELLRCHLLPVAGTGRLRTAWRLETLESSTATASEECRVDGGRIEVGDETAARSRSMYRRPLSKRCVQDVEQNPELTCRCRTWARRC